MRKNILIMISLFMSIGAFAQGVKFNRDLSPAEGLIKPQENRTATKYALTEDGTFSLCP